MALLNILDSLNNVNYIIGLLFVCLFVRSFVWRNSPQWARTSSFTRFLDHTQRRTTVGSTPLDEWSARRRDLYMTTHNTHNRQTSMPLVGFEPTISAGERPQTYALDRADTGTGTYWLIINLILIFPAALLSDNFSAAVIQPTRCWLVWGGLVISCPSDWGHQIFSGNMRK